MTVEKLGFILAVSVLVIRGISSVIHLVKMKRNKGKMLEEKYDSLKILEDTVSTLQGAVKTMEESESKVPEKLVHVYKSLAVLRNVCKRKETMAYYKPLVDKYDESFLLIKRSVEGTIKINLLGEEVVWEMTARLIDSIVLEFVEMEKLIKTNQKLTKQSELNSIVEQLKWEIELMEKFRSGKQEGKTQLDQVSLFKKY